MKLVSVQAVSSRPDVTPPSYTKELEKLQDQIPPFDDAAAMRVIVEELGRPINSIFSHITSTPVAAASLGQVMIWFRQPNFTRPLHGAFYISRFEGLQIVAMWYERFDWVACYTLLNQSLLLAVSCLHVAGAQQ